MVTNIGVRINSPWRYYKQQCDGMTLTSKIQQNGKNFKNMINCAAYYIYKAIKSTYDRDKKDQTLLLQMIQQ
jgi:hypothetical protein